MIFLFVSGLIIFTHLSDSFNLFFYQFQLTRKTVTLILEWQMEEYLIFKLPLLLSIENFQLLQHGLTLRVGAQVHMMITHIFRCRPCFHVAALILLLIAQLYECVDIIFLALIIFLIFIIFFF